MRIDILTLFPALFDGPFTESILRRAQEGGHVELYTHDIREYSKDKHKRVDDYQFGGGAGMVMQIQPIADAIEDLKSQRDYDHVIYMTPDGKIDTNIKEQLDGSSYYTDGELKSVPSGCFTIQQHLVTPTGQNIIIYLPSLKPCKKGKMVSGVSRYRPRRN